jgi:hypothetical protein
MVGTPRHVGLGIRSQQTTQKEHCQQRQKMSFHNLSIQIGCKGTKIIANNGIICLQKCAFGMLRTFANTFSW